MKNRETSLTIDEGLPMESVKNYLINQERSPSHFFAANCNCQRDGFFLALNDIVSRFYCTTNWRNCRRANSCAIISRRNRKTTRNFANDGGTASGTFDSAFLDALARVAS